MRRDDGVVAILVAVLITVILGIAAFAVDLGNAYVDKRQLSTATDAGALAAANVYAAAVTANNKIRTCSDLASDTTLRQNAQTAANAYLGNNTTTFGNTNIHNVVGGTLTVTCPPQFKDSQLWISFPATANSDTVFGGVVGIAHIPVSRAATAVVQPLSIGGGLRPIAMCMSLTSAQNVVNLANTTVPVYQPDPTCPKNSGNWDFLRCPGQGNSSDSALAANIQSGCSLPVSIIDTRSAQDGDTDDAVGDPTRACANLAPNNVPPAEGDNDGDICAIIATLQNLNNCVVNPSPTSPVATCFDASTGNKSNGAAVTSALYALSGTTGGTMPFARPATVLFPVVYDGSTFNPNGGSGGTYTRYPVFALLSATVCGFNNTSNKGGAVAVNDDPQWASLCPNADAAQAAAVAGAAAAGTSNYLLLHYSKLILTGSTSDGGATFGGPSDLGNRQMALIQ